MCRCLWNFCRCVCYVGWVIMLSVVVCSSLLMYIDLVVWLVRIWLWVGLCVIIVVMCRVGDVFLVSECR